MSHTAPTVLTPRELSLADPISPDAATVLRHLAHEMRQPLSTLEATVYYLDLILPRMDGRARRQVARMQQLVCQANWILSDALHYVQAAQPRPAVLDLEELLAECIADFSLDEQLPPLSLHLGAAGRLVYVDPAQAQHLLHTLFEVFRQISRAGAPIEVASGAESGMLWMKFRTTAPAPLLENPNSLFEPFGPHLPAGSGLALASVRRIVEAHRGAAEVRADGSTLEVCLHLPLAGTH